MPVWILFSWLLLITLDYFQLCPLKEIWKKQLLKGSFEVPYCLGQAPMGICSCSSAKIWRCAVTRRMYLNGSTIPTQGPTPDLQHWFVHKGVGIGGARGTTTLHNYFGGLSSPPPLVSDRYRYLAFYVPYTLSPFPNPCLWTLSVGSSWLWSPAAISDSTLEKRVHPRQLFC